MSTPTLHLLCGKIAAGKSTLSAKLVTEEAALAIAEDRWLAALYGPEMKTGQDFLRFSDRLKEVMGPHIVELLGQGLTVVLDFAANTVAQRAWMKSLIDQARVAHQLHYLDVPDEVCLARLKARNAAGEHALPRRRSSSAASPRTSNRQATRKALLLCGTYSAGDGDEVIPLRVVGVPLRRPSKVSQRLR